MSENSKLLGDAELMEMTSEIISAYVSNHSVAMSELASLIQTVHQTLSGAEAPGAPALEEIRKATPAQIKKSISPDALISFEDGKSYKTLKRHISKTGMNFEEYKSKWGLPPDYPTTAPSYSARRSEMAKARGFGGKPPLVAGAKSKAKKPAKGK